jgi:tetratricopeptide (TPR) repeat protein
MDPSSLDAIGISEGTNKSILWQDYLRHYERSFAPFKERQFTLLEIGVLSGSSVRTWERYFPHALIVGVDLDANARRHATDRIKIEIGSQNDPGFLNTLCTKYAPSIIIDDGSHMADDVLFTFERLFPALQPGGCYVIEDLEFHYEKAADRRIGTAKTLPRDMVNAIGRWLMDGEREAAGEHGFPRYLRQQVERTEIVRAAALIWKSPAPENYDLDAIQALVERSPEPDTWVSFSNLVFSQTRDLHRAADAVRRSLQRDPQRWGAYRHLAHLLELIGDKPGAVAALDAAIAYAPNAAKPELQTLQQRLQSHPEQ